MAAGIPGTEGPPSASDAPPVEAPILGEVDDMVAGGEDDSLEHPVTGDSSTASLPADTPGVTAPLDLTTADFTQDMHIPAPKDRAAAVAAKAAGNTHFGAGRWGDAIDCYTDALEAGPLETEADAKAMAVYFSNRAAAHMQLGDNETAWHDCTAALTHNPDYIKALVRRAKAGEATDRLDDAVKDYTRVLELDGGNAGAAAELHRLQAAVTKRDEALKEEMFGKLKDLGNTVLGNFGLSTDNFQFKQDPATGGYNINFVQNPGAGGGGS